MLIKNTTIVDGTGKPAFSGNVAIQGDRALYTGLDRNRESYQGSLTGHAGPPQSFDFTLSQNRVVDALPPISEVRSFPSS